MPIPSGVSHVVMRGAMPGGEAWAAGFWTALQAGETARDEAVRIANSNEFHELRDDLMAFNPTGVTLAALDVYRYANGGSGADDSGSAGVGAAGSATSNIHPNQIALCLTIRAAGSGRRRRNRCYVPALAVGVGTDGLADSTEVSTLVGDMATLLGSAGGVVVSQMAGASFDAIEVDADRVLDQQTGRRQGLTNSRIRVNVP